MSKHSPHLLLTVIVFYFLNSITITAHRIDANPATYTQYLKGLSAGDTLNLSAGVYDKGLTLSDISGNEALYVCIQGQDTATVFTSRSCCNTVSLTRCAYLCISHLRIEGSGAEVDAVKAEGTSGNWTHHITLEYLSITNFVGDQQVVGISTKCPSWNWIIRKNKIMGAGTGLYLGNSNGDAPFVNGIIEYNYVGGTIGYCMEIKHQTAGVRDAYGGTAVDAHTVIAHNVFYKDSSSSSGSAARPNVLVGGFAASGWGSKDYYEIYSNLFYENATEALFQGSGSMVLYNNIFINHSDGDGARAVYITSQNSIPPRNVSIFHNTVVCNNSAGGIRIYNADNTYQQQCFANLVLCANGVSNISTSYENIVDSFDKSSEYFLSFGSAISAIRCIAQANKAQGNIVNDSIVKRFSHARYDFNGEVYDWQFRGAYAHCCSVRGWAYALDTMTNVTENTSPVNDDASTFEPGLSDSPLMSMTGVPFALQRQLRGAGSAELFDLQGRSCWTRPLEEESTNISINPLQTGVYGLRESNATQFRFRLLFIQR